MGQVEQRNAVRGNAGEVETVRRGAATG